MKQENNETRNPFIAGLLSFLFPGLGQAYCGHLLKGLVLLSVVELFGAGVQSYSKYVLIPFFILAYIYSIYDANKTAEKLNNREKKYFGSISGDIIKFIIFSVIVTVFFGFILMTFLPPKDLNKLRTSAQAVRNEMIIIGYFHDIHLHIDSYYSDNKSYPKRLKDTIRSYDGYNIPTRLISANPKQYGYVFKYEHIDSEHFRITATPKNNNCEILVFDQTGALKELNTGQVIENYKTFVEK